MTPSPSQGSSRLVILDARLSGGRRVDVLIGNGSIASVEDSPDRSLDGDSWRGDPATTDAAATRIIDARGLTILPSFVDMHTHFRTPGLTHKEDLPHGCRAALAGGFTACNAMANTAPVCSTAAIADEVLREARALGLCDVYQSISATRGFDSLTTSHLDDEAIGQNTWIRAISDDGHGIASPTAFVEAARKAERLGKLFLIHPDPEDEETERDLMLAERHDLRLHFCHVSTEKSARAIVSARDKGARVTWEVTPHHLALNASEHPYQVNPPIRPESDRAFIEACVMGDLGDNFVPGAIATDHAPHTAQDKLDGAPGLVGLETAFAVTNTIAGLDAVGQLLSRGPRRLFGLPPVRIAPGYPADLVLVDPERTWIVDPASFFTKGRNTPFAGMTLTGTVEFTMKEGRVLYEHGQFV